MYLEKNRVKYVLRFHVYLIVQGKGTLSLAQWTELGESSIFSRTTVPHSNVAWSELSEYFAEAAVGDPGFWSEPTMSCTDTRAIHSKWWYTRCPLLIKNTDDCCSLDRCFDLGTSRATRVGDPFPFEKMLDIRASVSKSKLFSHGYFWPIRWIPAHDIMGI